MSDEFATARHAMVSEQLVRRGIIDRRVLQAMEDVPREQFVPVALRDQAYSDCALPIGYEQTISQPFTVAYMCEAAKLQGHEKVLEVGTGSGYAAAVLALLARELHTLERIADLFFAAAKRFRTMHIDNVHAHLSDGSLGLPSEAPFDVIIVAAGSKQVPTAFKEQVVEGGRVVMPLGPYGGQQMMRLTRRSADWEVENLGSFGFVPLVAGIADPTQEDQE